MDANEIQAITNRVTAQWLIWLQQRRPSGSASGSSLSDQERQFLNELRTYSERVLKYEDKELLDKALEHIPIHDLYEQALENDDPDASLDDKVIIRLMHWFKHDFFTWVNNPPCDFCGSSDTDEAGSALPTEEDKRYGARFVEIYRCKVCDKITRFPRYNDPAKLLETRRGRCGEWANCFTLCCRAVGADVRLVFDKTDHVWTECYSEVKERWVHCDSGEEAYDQPLLYSEGWGKKLNYCVSFSAEEAIDVTKRYTRNWPEVLKRRTLVREDKLKKFLNDLTAERQRSTPEDRKAILRERRKREEKELEDDSKRTNVKDGERVGRKTGSIEWRTARGETGTTVKQLLAKRKDAQDFSFKDLQLVSSASGLDGGITRLTSAKPDQVGGAYCSGQLSIPEAKAAVFEFELRITDKDGQGACDGADGMAFVIQSEGPTAIGEGGCQLGYGGLKNR
ncbi:hypothetical protein BJV82DRAFT_595041 [Fennellomyces sp. T-0311]|nr:hypothetical protein BJV82DRAFT_595041 [Fennellomyces sp. T-0311]